MLIKLRLATPQDADALLKIYAPYVKQTAISFKYDVPGAAEFVGRIGQTLQRYPYLLASVSDQATFANHERDENFKISASAAYDWSAECSVYVSRNAHALGIGRLLYEALQRALRAQNIVDMHACIACGDDEYLNDASVRFHERMGFRFVGRFERCAYKFGRWYDMAWMQKPIGEHLQNQPAMRPFARFRDEICASAGIEI